MFIYHYSSDIRSPILTKRKVGASKEETEQAAVEAKDPYEPGPYIDHISFFFDPIPSELMGKIYAPNHPVWFNGNTVYEHVVNVDQFESNILFHVAESKKRLKFLDDFIIDHNWVDDDDALLNKFIKESYELQVKWGEIGRSLSKLKTQIALHRGTTTKSILAAKARDDFQHGRLKYAANVPHLMLYPSSGTAVVSEVMKVVIGSAVRVNAGPVPTTLTWR